MIQSHSRIVMRRSALAATLACVAAVLAHAPSASATEEFAKGTGKACTTCHETATGGKLTPFGEQFKKSKVRAETTTGSALPP